MRSGRRAPAGVKVAHHVTRTLLLLVGFVRGGRVHPASLALHRVPGDVSLALVVQALAGQERRRFGPRGAAPAGPERDDEIDLREAAERAVLLDQHGEPLHTEQLVGDVPDPGVVLALLYESVARDAGGRRAYVPPPEACRETLAGAARTDTEIAAKLVRHLASPEATLMARLELGS